MCLKTELWVWISDISPKCLKSETESSDLRQIFKTVPENLTLSSDTKQFLNLF